jgi:hypothetical protein
MEVPLTLLQFTTAVYSRLDVYSRIFQVPFEVDKDVLSLQLFTPSIIGDRCSEIPITN